MTHHISVEGIKLYGFHGCLPEEGNIGGHYMVDVYLSTDFTEAAIQDDLSKTIDYCTVYEISKKHMAIRSKLIEQVAQRIHSELRSTFPQLQSLCVKLTKFNPPMNGDVEKVSVEIKD
jgi:dihydroneopterin aldolase